MRIIIDMKLVIGWFS